MLFINALATMDSRDAGASGISNAQMFLAQRCLETSARCDGGCITLFMGDLAECMRSRVMTMVQQHLRKHMRCMSVEHPVSISRRFPGPRSMWELPPTEVEAVLVNQAQAFQAIMHP